jgi:hypothetical protein
VGAQIEHHGEPEEHGRGSAVTVTATVNELFRIGLPLWMLLLFTGAGVLLGQPGRHLRAAPAPGPAAGAYRGIR